MLFYLAKLGLSLLILWLIFRRVDLGEVLRELAQIPVYIVLLVLAITMMRQYLQYRNWRYALKLNPWFCADEKQISRSFLIGIPLRFLLPGGHGSFAKVFFIDNSSKTASIAAVASEKLAQTWAILLFAAGSAFWVFPGWNLALKLMAFIVIALLPLIFGGFTKWHRDLTVLRDGYRKNIPRMLIIQVIAVLLTMLQYYLLLNTMSAISFGETTLRMSIVQFSDTIPITISGLGLRESFAMHFLETAGYAGGKAITATLALFFIQDVLTCIPGLALLIIRKKD